MVGEGDAVAALPAGHGFEARGIVGYFGQGSFASDGAHTLPADAATCPVGAGDMTTATGQIAGDFAHHRFRRDDFDVHDWLQNYRCSGADRGDQGLAGGGEKCHFLAVDCMMFAVINDDANVLDGIAADNTVGKRAADTFFNCRHIHRWNNTALDLVDELQARATRQRFNT